VTTTATRDEIAEAIAFLTGTTYRADVPLLN